MEKENILLVLFLLVLMCLIFIAEERVRGEKDVSVFSCFGEGCSGLDITVSCLSVLLILIIMCHCLMRLKDCAKCCDKCCGREEEEELQLEAV